MRSMNHPNLIKIYEVIEAEDKVGVGWCEAGAVLWEDGGVMCGACMASGGVGGPPADGQPASGTAHAPSSPVS